MNMNHTAEGIKRNCASLHVAKVIDMMPGVA